MGGYPAQFTQSITPNPTPLQTALGVGTTLAGIYGAVNPRPIQFAAEGGRMGYAEGSDKKGIMQVADIDDVRNSYSQLMFGKDIIELTPDELEEFEELFKMEYGGE
jgi:hypothetical protein